MLPRFSVFFSVRGVKVSTPDPTQATQHSHTQGPGSLTSQRVTARGAARRRPLASFPRGVLSSALTRAGTIQRSDALLGHRI